MAMSTASNVANYISIEVSVHGLLKLCASQMAGSETLWFDSEGNGPQSG